MANIRIPLPRVPTWVARGLDAYSTWAEKPIWSVIARRDAISVGIIAVVSGSYGLWTDSWMGFALGLAVGVLSWVAIEAYHA